MPRGIPGSGPHARTPKKKTYKVRSGNGRRKANPWPDAAIQVLQATEHYIADLERKLQAARRLLVTLQHTYRDTK